MYRQLLAISPEGLDRVKRSLELHVALAASPLMQSLERIAARPAEEAKPARSELQHSFERAPSDFIDDEDEDEKTVVTETSAIEGEIQEQGRTLRRIRLFRQHLEDGVLRKKWAEEDVKSRAVQAKARTEAAKALAAEALQKRRKKAPPKFGIAAIGTPDQSPIAPTPPPPPAAAPPSGGRGARPPLSPPMRHSASPFRGRDRRVSTHELDPALLAVLDQHRAKMKLRRGQRRRSTAEGVTDLEPGEDDMLTEQQVRELQRMYERQQRLAEIMEDDDEGDMLVTLATPELDEAANAEPLEGMGKDVFSFVIGRALYRIDQQKYDEEGFMMAAASSTSEEDESDSRSPFRDAQLSSSGVTFASPRGFAARGDETLRSTDLSNTIRTPQSLQSHATNRLGQTSAIMSTTMGIMSAAGPMLLEEAVDLAGELFAHIDTDGRGRLDWATFTEYLIEEAEQVTAGRATAGQFDKYSINPAIKIHEDAKSIMSVQNSRYLFLVLKEHTELVVPETLERHHIIATTAVIDAVFASAPTNMTSGSPAFITSGTDLHLRVYDFGTRSKSHLKLKNSKNMRCSATILKMRLVGDKLYAGDRSGTVTVLNVQTLCNGTVSTMESATMGWCTPHTKAITALEVLPSSVMVTAALDGRVATTDAHELFPLKSFMAHDGGVASLSISHRHGYLLTQGFAKTTKVWVGYSGTNTFTLYDGNSPHMHNVMYVEAIDDLNHIITMDYSGHVKVWNLRNNQPLFDAHVASRSGFTGGRKGLGNAPDTSVAPVQYGVYVRKLRRIITVGHRSRAVADFVPGKAVLKAHDEPIRHAVASLDVGCCITASNDAVKQWSVRQGGLIRGSVVPPESGDVSAMAVDSHGTKYYLALTTGAIEERRLESGRLLKTFSTQQAPVLIVPEDDRVPTKSTGAGGSLAKRRGKGEEGDASRKLLGVPPRVTGDVLAMNYLEFQQGKVRELCCAYADGILRFYSDVGTERLPSRIIDTAFEEKRDRLKALEKAMKKGGDINAVSVYEPGSPVIPGSPGVADFALDDTGTSKEDGIAMAAFSVPCRLSAVINPVGVVKVIDLQSASGVALHRYKIPGDPSCMSFLGHYPCLVVGDTAGGLAFFLVRPAALLAFGDDGKWLVRIENPGGVPVSMAYDESSASLLVGDTTGHTTVFDVTRLIAEASLEPLQTYEAIDSMFDQQKRLRDAVTRMRHTSFCIPTDADTEQLGASVRAFRKSLSVTQGFSDGYGTTTGNELERIRSKSFLTQALEDDDAERRGSGNVFDEIGAMEKSRRSMSSRADALVTKVRSVTVTQGQLSQLCVLNTGHVIVTDLNGAAAIWAPQLSEMLTILNPSASLSDRLHGVRAFRDGEIRRLHNSHVRRLVDVEDRRRRHRASEIQAMRDAIPSPDFGLGGTRTVGIEDLPDLPDESLSLQSTVEEDNDSLNATRESFNLTIGGDDDDGGDKGSESLPPSSGRPPRSVQLGRGTSPPTSALRGARNTRRSLGITGVKLQLTIDDEPVSPGSRSRRNRSVAFSPNLENLGDATPPEVASPKHRASVIMRRTGAADKPSPRLSLWSLREPLENQAPGESQRGTAFGSRSMSTLSASSATPAYVPPTRPRVRVPLVTRPPPQQVRDSAASVQTARISSHQSVVDFVESHEATAKALAATRKEEERRARAGHKSTRRSSPQTRSSPSPPKSKPELGFLSLADVREQRVSYDVRPVAPDSLGPDAEHRLAVEEAVARGVQREHTGLRRNMAMTTPSQRVEHLDAMFGRAPALSPANQRPLYGLELPENVSRRHADSVRRSQVGLTGYHKKGE